MALVFAAIAVRSRNTPARADAPRLGRRLNPSQGKSWGANAPHFGDGSEYGGGRDVLGGELYAGIRRVGRVEARDSLPRKSQLARHNLKKNENNGLMVTR
jgi:hypothetical protein